MRTSEILLSIAAFIMIAAGMKTAAVSVVPFILSALIAIVCAPPMFWLQEKGVPTLPATLFTVLLIVAAGIVMAALVGQAVNDFSQDPPLHKEKIKLETQAAAKIALDSRPETRWPAIVPGPGQASALKPLASSPPKPNEPVSDGSQKPAL